MRTAAAAVPAVHTVTGRVCMPAYNPLRLIARKNDSRRFSNWIRERVRLVPGVGAEKFPIPRSGSPRGDVVQRQRRQRRRLTWGHGYLNEHGYETSNPL